jgi:hypothetical protein
MKPLWIATLAAILLCCGPAFSQVSGVGSPTPGIAATSPLSMTPGASVPPTGIPLGATELASPGLSPVTVGTPGMTGYGATCSAGSPTSSGTSGTYDGGGIALGMGTALPGSMATCTGSGNSVPSTDAAPSVARTGIPLGSVEIGNAGVSPLLTAPTPGASPSMFGTLSPNPSTMGAPATPPSTVGAAGVLSPTTGSPAALSTDGTGQPCGSVPTSTPETGC